MIYGNKCMYYVSVIFIILNNYVYNIIYFYSMVCSMYLHIFCMHSKQAY